MGGLKLLVTYVVLRGSMVFASSGESSNIRRKLESARLWTEYKNEHLLRFTEAEDEVRRGIFENNLRYIWERNSMNLSYSLAMNTFGHLRGDEVPLCARFNGPSQPGVRVAKYPYSGSDQVRLPDEVDWRNYGVITQPKDQMACGSCYAFSAVGAIEALYAINNGKLVRLSEQEVIDCSKDQGNRGCNGGWMQNVFEYVKEKGISGEDMYGYMGTESFCMSNVSKIVPSLGGYALIPEGREDILQITLSIKGPVSSAVDASERDFRFYSSGVYYSQTCKSATTDLNHGVLLVGYGSKESTEFYIAKNSWGMKWGEDGYIRMAKNRGNNCGVATASSYPF